MPAQKLRQLEAENAKLKHIVADLTLDNVALKDVSKTGEARCQTNRCAKCPERHGLSRRRIWPDPMLNRHYGPSSHAVLTTAHCAPDFASCGDRQPGFAGCRSAVVWCA